MGEFDTLAKIDSRHLGTRSTQSKEQAATYNTRHQMGECKMTTLLYEFKQGNKILAKIYHNKEAKFPWRVSLRGICGDYKTLIEAIDRTHLYICGVLSVSTNKKYIMIEHEYIDQYILLIRYNFTARTEDFSTFEGKKMIKRMLA